MLTWYMESKEEVDSKTTVIAEEGTGIKITFNEEPLVKFTKVRHRCRIDGDVIKNSEK